MSENVFAKAIENAAKINAKSREQAAEVVAEAQQRAVTELVKEEKGKKMIEVAAQKALNTEAYQEIRKAARALLPFTKELPKRDAALLFSIDNLATITFGEAQGAWKLLRKHASLLKDIDVNAISAPKRIDSTGTEKTIVTPLPLPEPHSPLGVWDALGRFEQRYIWFPEDSSHLLLKLWIAHTYVKEQLTDDYHLLPAGKTESGKNQVLHTVFLTSSSGYAASSMKPAGLFRSVEANPTMTLILEEFTVPYNPDEDSKDIVELLLSMISRNKKVIRVERISEEFQPIEYNLFGGVAFSTKDLGRFQEDLRNRCIVLPTVKAPLEEQRPKLAAIDTDETRAIRSGLLGAAQEMRARWDALVAREPPKSFRRFYRFKDIYMVLQPVARYFGVERELEEALMEKVREYAAYKRESFDGEVIGTLVRAYAGVRKRLESDSNAPKHPTLDTLFALNLPSEIELPNGRSKKVTKRMVAAILRKHGCELVEEKSREKEHIARATYIVIKETYLADLASEFGVTA